jgi:hypothetical protein
VGLALITLTFAGEAFEAIALEEIRATGLEAFFNDLGTYRSLLSDRPQIRIANSPDEIQWEAGEKWVELYFANEPE